LVDCRLTLCQDLLGIAFSLSVSMDLHLDDVMQTLRAINARFNPYDDCRLTIQPFMCQDLLGVAFNRIVRMDLASGDVLQTWRYENVKTWSVNWENKHVQVELMVCLSVPL